jgi:hypothetical protein
MCEVTGQLQPAPNFQHAYYDLDRCCVSSVFAQAVLLWALFHAVLNVHLWCKPCASQKLTTPAFQLPTFAPLNLNSDSKWYANVNAFLLDRNPSQVMDFYCIFENNRGSNTASSPSCSSNGDRKGGGKEGSNGGGITNLSIYLGI